MAARIFSRSIPLLVAVISLPAAAARSATVSFPAITRPAPPFTIERGNVVKLQVILFQTAALRPRKTIP
jgi:hypothetical protein